jgi:hypothetical protein
MVIRSPFPRHEDSAATGIDGNQADNSMANSGAVYVFTRREAPGHNRRTSRRPTPVRRKKVISSVLDRLEQRRQRWSWARSAKTATRPASTVTRTMKEPRAPARYVFTRSGAPGHSRRTQSREHDGELPVRLFVAMSANGNTVAIGSFDEGGSSREINGPTIGEGQVRGGLRAHPQRHELVAAGASEGQGRRRAGSMGCWVAISDDGNTVAAGALDEDTLVPGSTWCRAASRES